MLRLLTKQKRNADALGPPGRMGNYFSVWQRGQIARE